MVTYLGQMTMLNSELQMNKEKIFEILNDNRFEKKESA